MTFNIILMKISIKKYIKAYYKKMLWFHMVIKKMDKYVAVVDKILKKKDQKV
jgi:hypothetical protein